MTGPDTAGSSATAGTRAGAGRAGAHHGELLQGVFRTAYGRLTRGLVTLPCPLFQAQVRAALEPGRRSVEVAPAWKVKAAAAARLTLEALGVDHVGATLTIGGEIPVRRGYGSSTSDVVATVRAICSAVGVQLDEAEVAKLAVQAEVASDPLMFDRLVLFAQRDGVVLEEFGAPVPNLEVLGFSTGDGRPGVGTLAFAPARYSPAEVEQFEELRLRLRHALAAGDVREIGFVATASARLNQRHLPVPGFGGLLGIVAGVGAMGMQVAHSGDVAGLLFDPAVPDLEEQLEVARGFLARAGIAETWRFAL